MESYIDGVINQKNGNSTSELAEMANQVVPMLRKVQNLVERNSLIEYFSSEAKIDDASFLVELKKSFSKNQSRVEVFEAKTDSILCWERHLVQLILSDKETAQKVLQAVDPEDFSNAALRDIAITCSHKIQENESLEIDKLIDNTEDPETKTIITQLGLEPLEFDSVEKSVSDCIKKFNSFHLKSKIKFYKKQRNEANTAGQIERSNEINRKIQEMYSALTH